MCSTNVRKNTMAHLMSRKMATEIMLELCEGAQRTVCVQGPMWRLAIVSQMTHTARALTVMHARRVILNILQSSSVDLSFVVDAFASNVTSILNFSRLLVATNEPSNTEAFGEQVTRLLVSHSKDSDSVAQAILGEAISVLMSSIYKNEGRLRRKR